MRLPTYLFIFLICISSGFAPATGQTKSIKTDSLDAKIQEVRGTAANDPAEAKKNLLELKKYSEKINHKDGVMRSSMGLLLIYYNDGDYKKTIEESRILEQYARELNDFEYLSDLHRMRGNAYGEMGLGGEDLEELSKAIPFADKIEQDFRRYYKKALIYESFAGTYGQADNVEKEIFYRQKSISETKKMPERNPGVINAKYQNLALQYAGLGLVYSNQKNKDSAHYYFDEAYKITESNEYQIYHNLRATLLSDMAAFYDVNKDHQKAITFAKRAETLEKQAPMPYIRRGIFHSLFNSYAETNKLDSSRYYLKLYTSLNDSLLKSEKEDIMTPVKQIISDKETENRNILRNVSIAAAVLVLIGWVYWKWRNQILRKKYEAIISQIKSEPHTEETHQEIITNQEPKTPLIITDDTLKFLLVKLDKFEKSKLFMRKDVSRPWLATHLNTNTKYMTEVIKIQSGTTFTNYIHKLRISYIIRKLVEEPKYREYKIEYLADECGYGSRQVFITAFKSETGFTPSYFIENLKKDALENRA